MWKQNKQGIKWYTVWFQLHKIKKGKTIYKKWAWKEIHLSGFSLSCFKIFFLVKMFSQILFKCFFEVTILICMIKDKTLRDIVG